MTGLLGHGQPEGGEVIAVIQAAVARLAVSPEADDLHAAS
jgi:hypothetical protein